MGSIISKIADEIRIHGTYEKYVAFRDREEDIPYFPDPEVIENKDHYSAVRNAIGNNMINAAIEAAKAGEEFRKAINKAYPNPNI